MDAGTLLLLLVAAALLLLLLTRGRRQQREALAVQNRLQPGAEVMTSSGLFATVVAVEGTVVVLETAPGQRSRWDRRAVARVVTDTSAAIPEPGAWPAPQSGQAAPAPPDEVTGSPERPDDSEPPGRE